MMFRVGMGHDSHPFGDDPHKPLMIGGVTFADMPGFAGNSDGDVVLHALCDAMEQAIGGNSFALYADRLCLDEGVTDSAAYLAVARTHLRDAGWTLNNIGISLECATPRIMPRVEDIRARIAALTGVAPGAIGITATSGDGLSDVARGAGVAAHVIVSVVQNENASSI